MHKSTYAHFESAVAAKNIDCERNLNDWQYSVLPENVYHADLGKYHTYGIQVSGTDFPEIIHDVSTCKETVDQIVDLLNLHQLLPIHLRDVVEDMLP